MHGAQGRVPGYICRPEEVVLVTGAAGFIGAKVVTTLLSLGFRRIRCLVRPSGDVSKLEAIAGDAGQARLELVRGNLLSLYSCEAAVQGAAVVYHLAAGTEKSFPGCVLNSAVATRNLLEAIGPGNGLRRFVNVSSLAVYANADLRRGAPLDETCPVDRKLIERNDAYAYAKAMQDDLVSDYGRDRGLPYVIVRPGVTFGPGKPRIPGRVGIDTFGVFLQIGLATPLPVTFLDNCAEAIVLAGLVPGIEGEVVNIVDDDLPTCAQFLREYKREVRSFRSITLPYPAFYFLSYLWESYSARSRGQLPPVFNRRSCASYYRPRRYCNEKAKAMLGWRPRVRMDRALRLYCDYARAMLAPAGTARNSGRC